jgi:rhamnosyltransferase
VRKYWKISEQMMVKRADLLVCDSKNIEKYIQQSYERYNPKTTFIAYGAETKASILADDDEQLQGWYREKGLTAGEYYLVVGRFVPENNYETMLREFMASKTEKSFALITNVTDSFLEELEQKTGFHTDPRIKFVGVVYDQELLRKIRQNARGYFHGHEVGGTNPSLLEALGSTKVNLLLDVGFNREVAEDAALYWTKEEGSLARLIEDADALPPEAVEDLGHRAKNRIATAYSWQFICDEYEKLFLAEGGRG